MRRRKTFLSNKTIIARLAITISIIVIASLIIGYILTNFINQSFRIILEYEAIALFIIGSATVFGGRKLSYGYNYNMVKSTNEIEDLPRKDLGLFLESYGFCIYLGLSAFILLLISLLIFKLQ